MSLLVFKILPNGTHSGPALFQIIIDGLLASIPKAAGRLDVFLLPELIMKITLILLSEVLKKLLKYGFKRNKSKSKFLQSSVHLLCI